MSQLFLGYVVAVAEDDYRKSIYRTAIGSPQTTQSDSADTLTNAEDTAYWLVSLLEDEGVNTYAQIPDGIPADVKLDIQTMFTDVAADVQDGLKSSIKLSLLDQYLHAGYDDPVLTLKAVITSAGVKSVTYFPLIENDPG